MQLLRGAAAARAVSALTAKPALAVLVADPLAGRGESPRVLAVACGDDAVVLEPSSELDQVLALPRPFGAYDAKHTHRALLAAGMTGPQRWACVRLCEQLILGGRPQPLDLSNLAKRYGKDEPPDPKGGLDELAAYAKSIACVLDEQVAHLKRDGLTWVSRIEAAAVAPIAAMEHYGMPFDAERWRQLGQQAAAERAKLKGRLGELLGAQTDLFGSPSSALDNDGALKELLAAAGFRVPNARRATLAALPKPLGPVLARYRELGKLTTAYGDSFLSHVGKDGRLHPTFEQIGASTGRLSCHEPNLQSIVKDAPHRGCFRAPPGRTLVIGDYATCELRILAEMSGDPVFAEAFARGDDLHARVATRVFGKPVSKTENPELRERAKAVSFGLVYGMGAGGLARATGASLRQAEQLLARYFESFPKIRGFLESAAKDALARGYAHTLTGRRLYLEAGPDRDSRSQAERIAKNMPIQGTSADITKLALTRVHQALPKGASLVNTVHDEIVVECDQNAARSLCDILEREMTHAAAEVLKHTPVVVDVAASATWEK